MEDRTKFVPSFGDECPEAPSKISPVTSCKNKGTILFVLAAKMIIWGVAF